MIARNPPAVVDRLVTENTGLANLAAQMCKNFSGARGHDFEDLVQTAMLGLIDAARIYDPAKGRFSTLGMRCALQSIWRVTGREKDKRRVAKERQMPVMACGRPREFAAPAVDPDDAIDLKDLPARFARAGLTEREHVALTMRLDDATLDEMARAIGCSREWARVLYEKAVAKVRRQFTEATL